MGAPDRGSMALLVLRLLRLCSLGVFVEIIGFASKLMGDNLWTKSARYL